MTIELKDLYLAQCEQWIIGQRSAAQYLLGINDIYGWMICAGSKLRNGVEWRWGDDYASGPYFKPDGNGLFIECDPIMVKALTGQDAKDAHLDELRRGVKAHPVCRP